MESKNNQNPLIIHWFRRDLRLEDNKALSEATNTGIPVLPVFIFDTHILSELSRDDSRVSFIYNILHDINNQLAEIGSSIKIEIGKPVEIFKKLSSEFQIKDVFFNEDYEPYAIERDLQVQNFLLKNGINVNKYKDQVIFAKDEILKPDGKPYTIFTPYKNKWYSVFTRAADLQEYKVNPANFIKIAHEFPSLDKIGFSFSIIKVKPLNLDFIDNYEALRNLPAEDKTSYAGPHLRFGTMSIRQLIRNIKPNNESYLSELIWREFFMQILYHYPHVVHHNFKRQYDGIKWLNNEKDFAKWAQGNTGYPFVDAGMRQLVQTGYMHNRVRMVTASFLTKHLLIDWRIGEAFFAKHLLDFDLSSNNGNWQWAAGTGCDAAPYFRVFNPCEQVKRFDPELKYTRKWVHELNNLSYPKPMINHKFARERALQVYKRSINKI